MAIVNTEDPDLEKRENRFMYRASVVLFIICALIFIYFMTRFNIEIITRRDFTLHQKTMWSIANSWMPVIGNLTYAIAGSRNLAVYP